MSDYREQVFSAIRTLVTSGGGLLTDDDTNVLGKAHEVAGEYIEALAEIYNAMQYGFFHCAAIGTVMVPEDSINSRFGLSINDNYPEANEVFLRFAKTYWSLNILVNDTMQNDMEWIGAALLVKLEKSIGPLFFPFPGPATIPPSRREKDQRECIKVSGANIDIEEFMKGNPILIRDRSKKRGCLGIALLFLFGIAILICIIILL